MKSAEVYARVPVTSAISRQHDEIIDAVANHDADRAETLVRKHLDLSRKNMAMYAAPEGMQIPLGV